MEWIDSLFFEHSAIQAIVVLSLVTAAGLWLGKMHVWGISLGVTFVFFVGILAGHLGISLDADMLNYAESFGLVLFVYALGLQVGPGFFSSLRHGGVKLNLLSLGVIFIGTAMTVLKMPIQRPGRGSHAVRHGKRASRSQGRLMPSPRQIKTTKDSSAEAESA